MKRLVKSYIGYLAMWLIIFLLSRLAFHIANYGEANQAGFSAFLGSFIHGFRLDLSMSAYFVLIPFLFFSVIMLMFKQNGKKIIDILHYLLFIPSIIIVSIDAQLFKYWGFKLDLTPFRFILTSSEDAAASIRFIDVLVVVLVFALLFVAGVWLFRKMVAKSMKQVESKRYLGFTGLVLCSVLFLPIRGSVDVSPIGLSSAYFHEEHYPNQAAVNSVWNFMHALTIADQEQALELAGAEESVGLKDSLFSGANPAFMPELEVENPNIILIVLESFSAKLVGAIGGEEGLTPELNKLAESSILFENYYACGDRSDIGLTSMLTGYPAMPNKHILTHLHKLSALPNLYRTLGENGYSTSFYYGGNLEFANLKSLFVTGKVENIISQPDLPEYPDDGKWGVHDGHVFDHMAEGLSKSKQPFFGAVFGMSSHEPYDVPAQYNKFHGNMSEFRNAIYYTDSCLGSLIKQLKESQVWDISIVIVTADHGNRPPDMAAVNHPNKFRIPVLFTGGAVDTSYRIKAHCSQSDLSLTLLQWLGIPYEQTDYPFSSNMFDPSSDFAFYFYNNGVGYRDTTGGIVYDITGDYTTFKEGSDSLKYVNRAKKMTQAVHDDFLVR